MDYTGEYTKEISFPLGGIGSGCIGLAGNGRLCDWEIFNRSNKNSTLSYTHFCISAAGKYRLLQGDCFEPYTGKYRYQDDDKHRGYGWGVEHELLAGLPHFRQHTFHGTFPVAGVDFSGEEDAFPVTAELLAWSPFIPGMDRESSLPCAVLEYTFKNISGETVEASAVGVLANPWNCAGHKNIISGGGTRLTLTDGNENGLALSVREEAENVSSQAYWYRGGWSDGLEMYLNDLAELSSGKRFRPRDYEPGEIFNDHGVLAVHFSLQPGESRTVQFIITWHVPTRTNTWSSVSREEAEKQGIAPAWKNYYATQWQDQDASADELCQRFDELRAGTMQFRNALFDSTLDEAIVNGASACLSTLKSPTCLRLEDGTLYGWEGTGTHWGSCEGSCIHVWNYAQAAAFLFPALERSMQESHLKYDVRADGCLNFRLMLPLGIKVQPEHDWLRPCADGQFGTIMKCYRDWKICGDQNWLETYYPTLKRLMQFAWSSENQFRWDPEKTGLIGGRQHHTLDMELFGPSSWIQSLYLGALAAMEKMAEAVGDHDFSAECGTILEKGKAAADCLFNGEYYQQNVDLKDKNIPAQWDDAVATYWNTESEEIKYQIGDGLEIDACLGEFFASFYGIGSVLDPEMTEKTLEAILRYNFKSTRDLTNPWRIYAVNDEKGVCICTWENGRKKPAIPIPYNTEMMHGFEWTFAAHLMMLGKTGEAAETAQSIRNRYDGRKRNPWNEFECGNNYARSMAAFALIPAAAGFTFDMTRQYIGFDPKYPAGEEFRGFWSIGSAWGRIIRSKANTFTMTVDYGSITLDEVQFAGQHVPIRRTLRKGDSISKKI